MSRRDPPQTFAELILVPSNRAAVTAVRAWAAARRGEPRALVLLGPSGTGKTALARAAAQELRHDQGSDRVLVASAHDALTSGVLVTASPRSPQGRAVDLNRITALFCEHLEDLVGRGAAARLLADRVGSVLARGGRCLLTATSGVRRDAWRLDEVLAVLPRHRAIETRYLQPDERQRVAEELAARRGLKVPPGFGLSASTFAALIGELDRYELSRASDPSSGDA